HALVHFGLFYLFDRNANLGDALSEIAMRRYLLVGIVGLLVMVPLAVPASTNNRTCTGLGCWKRSVCTWCRCYAHIGTGNYHVKTARMYTDLGLLTCDPVITSDVVDLFHALTGWSHKHDTAKLLVAPLNMRERFRSLIEREVAHCQAGRHAHI